MKYIDAKKLYEYLEQVGTCYPRYIDNIVDNAVSNVIDCIKTFVTSLQQEQPEFPTTDEEVEKVLASIPKVELPDKYKTPDWLFKQQEQPDYKEAVQLVFEEELTPFKDGNQWCFLLGRNIQEGVCGFGDTILDAAVAFYKDYTNTRIHIGELKISMAQHEQPEGGCSEKPNDLLREQQEVDLEKEITEHAENMPHGEFTHDSECREHEEWAMKEFRYFYELGLNARKEE